MYIERPFHHFINDLASDKSSPGGGSVAALIGVQAVSLVLMVSRLTIGKKKYEAVEEQVNILISKASKIKDSFTRKVDEDVKIFNEIMDCYKVPKDQREEPLQKALKKSALFSFSMIEDALKIMELAKEIAEIGNTNLISDSAIAVYLAYSTMECSLVNVRINLKSLKDSSVCDKLEEDMQKLFTKAQQLKEDALTTIDKTLKVRL